MSDTIDFGVKGETKVELHNQATKILADLGYPDLMYDMHVQPVVAVNTGRIIQWEEGVHAEDRPSNRPINTH